MITIFPIVDCLQHDLVVRRDAATARAFRGPQPRSLWRGIDASGCIDREVRALQ